MRQSSHWQSFLSGVLLLTSSAHFLKMYPNPSRYPSMCSVCFREEVSASEQQPTISFISSVLSDRHHLLFCSIYPSGLRVHSISTELTVIWQSLDDARCGDGSRSVDFQVYTEHVAHRVQREKVRRWLILSGSFCCMVCVSANTNQTTNVACMWLGCDVPFVDSGKTSKPGHRHRCSRAILHVDTDRSDRVGGIYGVALHSCTFDG